jgi:hypothetical protein
VPELQVPVPTVPQLWPVPKLLLHRHRHQGAQTQASCPGTWAGQIPPMWRDSSLRSFLELKWILMSPTELGGKVLPSLVPSWIIILSTLTYCCKISSLYHFESVLHNFPNLWCTLFLIRECTSDLFPTLFKRRCRTCWLLTYRRAITWPLGRKWLH